MRGKGPHANVRQESNILRNFIREKVISADQIVETGWKDMRRDVLEIYKHRDSWQKGVRRFMNQGGGLNFRNRFLIERVVYLILTRRNAPMEITEHELHEAEQVVTEPIEALTNNHHARLLSGIMAPCPTCGQSAAVRLHADGTWEFVKDASR